jgi:SIT family siderophore-iron:H+ symporter-like MFS transporter
VKLFIIAGTLLFLPAFGLLIRFRGGSDSPNHNGIIGSQILLGFGKSWCCRSFFAFLTHSPAAGFVPYPTQTAIQAATRHEHVAIITGLFLATFNIGSAFGSAVSGAIWTQTLIPSLRVHLPEPYNTEAMAKSIFANPFNYASRYPIGDPLRDAIVLSYMHTQKMLTVTGICLCAPLIMFSLVLRNVRLGDEQSLPNAEAYDGNTKAEKDGGWNLFKLWK